MYTSVGSEIIVWIESERDTHTHMYVINPSMRTHTCVFVYTHNELIKYQISSLPFFSNLIRAAVENK
jgi:3-dehydroquinate dehydratase